MIRTKPLAWLIAAALAGPSCGLTGPREASRAAAERSFEPYRGRKIGTEELEAFLRRRTAIVASGPSELAAQQCAVWFSGVELSRAEGSGDGEASAATAALSAGCALSEDGYFLTAAHGLARGPAHVAIEARGAIEIARAHIVWSDGERDVALLHADLQPEAWFELAPDRALPAGELLLAYSPAVGPAAGELEVAVDLPSLDPYSTLALPHDTPLRGGHSGGPAALADGQLLGVQTSTGMDTIFLRRSWLARVNPSELARRIADDRLGAAPH